MGIFRGAFGKEASLEAESIQGQSYFALHTGALKNQWLPQSMKHWGPKPVSQSRGHKWPKLRYLLSRKTELFPVISVGPPLIVLFQEPRANELCCYLI